MMIENAFLRVVKLCSSCESEALYAKSRNAGNEEAWGNEVLAK
jgi:hypothetical protein